MDLNHLQDDMLSNPFWHALQTEHAAFSMGQGAARRYPADVIPFSAFEFGTNQDFDDLFDLLEPGETTFVVTNGSSGLKHLDTIAELEVLQMHFPAGGVPSSSSVKSEGNKVQELNSNDAAAMVALTDVAFPGFFRVSTYQLGRYFGVRVNGDLVALAGERIALPGWREISAVCTHPDHIGQGYAARLINHLLRLHLSNGLRSFLHVTATNERAIRLYEHLGFVKDTLLTVKQFRRF